MCIRSSLHSVRFGQLLRCAHKHIVNIVKVYIERNNMQVEELIRFCTKIISSLFTFTIAKRGIQRDSHIYPWIVVTAYACSIVFVITLIILDMSSLFCAQRSHGKSFPDVHVR